jgi:hypothetical protein
MDSLESYAANYLDDFVDGIELGAECQEVFGFDADVFERFHDRLDVCAALVRREQQVTNHAVLDALDVFQILAIGPVSSLQVQKQLQAGGAFPKPVKLPID